MGEPSDRVYTKLSFPPVQVAPSATAQSAQEEGQNALSTKGNLPLALTKEFKSIKKEYVGHTPDVVSVIAYLNDKADKQFNASSKAAERLVKGRFPGRVYSGGLQKGRRKEVRQSRLNQTLAKGRRNGWRAMSRFNRMPVCDTTQALS